MTKIRPVSQLWRLLLGLVIIVVVTFALGLIAGHVLNLVNWPRQPDTLNRINTLIFLSSFAFTIMGVVLATRVMQKRGFWSVVGDPAKTLSQFNRSLRAVVLLIIIVVSLPPYDIGAPLTQNLAFPVWLSLLPVSLIAILIQTSAEEILFRGYLQQCLAARFNSPLVWIGVPSILFGLLHYDPNAGDNSLFIVLWATVFGFLAADLTARAGTLGPAIAMHFANNFVAILLISTTSFQGSLSLYQFPFDIADAELLRQWIIVDFFVVVVTWLAIRIAIRR